jgi:hypothetical protein
MPTSKLNNKGTPTGKGLFHCIPFSWELQADKPVRWDVAERLNRKQKHKQSE